MLIDAVLTAASRRGSVICPDAGVTSLLQERDRCTGVVAGGEKITCRHVVVAAGCFSACIGRDDPGGISPGIARESDFVARYAPTRPVRGQMLELQPRGESLRHVLRSERGYLVPRRGGRIVAGSTLEEAGFNKHVTAAGIRQILDAALELLPGLGSAEILENWAGLRPGTPDNLPVLGPTDIEGLIIATGHYRNGILLAPATAKLIREWITEGQAGFDAAAFSPLRFSNQPRSAQKCL
jgi:glycine oxidase